MPQLSHPQKIRFFQNLSKRTIALNRATKISIVLAVDVFLCVITVWIAYYLRLGEFVNITRTNLIPLIISVSIAVPVFSLSGLYKAIFRYGGYPTLLSVTKTITTYSFLYMFVITGIGIEGVPRTIGIIQPILLFLAVIASRLLAQFWFSDKYQSLTKSGNIQKVVIYGAGIAGRQLAVALSNIPDMKLVGFLDDDRSLHGHVLNGVPIYDPTNLSALTQKLSIVYVLLAMPSVNRKRHNEILSKIRNVKVSVRTLPSVSDLVQGKVKVSDLRELDINDILGRESVEPNQVLLSKNIAGKVIVVTGAGGSIGSELSRQIIALKPEKLLLVEHSEFALYKIHQELECGENIVQLIPLLASVHDNNRINEIISTWRPHTVYHAAAYKHVPLVEHNLAEGIKNNVLGTLVSAQAAIANEVENFVLISTDKAVRPTNIMGASKRLAEMILQALAVTRHSTKLSMVRFGNVLDSSGSVVPKFRQQIKEGGPVTITHPEITRFFMTIPEASQLVIQAGAMAEGGDVFVLDMGEQVKILDLAQRMIQLSGLSLRNAENPDGDIEIKTTNLRPGEKLYEELLITDNPVATLHSKIFKAHDSYVSWDNLNKELEKLTIALNNNDVIVIRQLIDSLVPDYHLSRNIVDWVHLERFKNDM